MLNKKNHKNFQNIKVSTGGIPGASNTGSNSLLL
jgi:hypothetical protein